MDPAPAQRRSATPARPRFFPLGTGISRAPLHQPAGVLEKVRVPSAASRLLPQAEARPFPLFPELAGSELGHFFSTPDRLEMGRNLTRGRARRESVVWVKKSERDPWEPRSPLFPSPPDFLLPSSAATLREGGSDNRAKASLMSWGVKFSPLPLPLQNC